MRFASNDAVVACIVDLQKALPSSGDKMKEIKQMVQTLKLQVAVRAALAVNTGEEARDFIEKLPSSTQILVVQCRQQRRQ